MKSGYSTGKGVFLALMTFALAAAGCSDDDTKGKLPDPDQGVSKLTASIRNTRVEPGDAADGKVPAVWSDGDRLMAQVGDRTCFYRLASGEGTETGVFEFEGEKTDAPMPPFTLCYPAEAGTLPAEQRYVADGFDPAAVVMTATAEDPTGESLKTGALAVDFSKGYATLVLRLKGDLTVVSATVTDPEQPLAGEAQTVTLDCGDGVALDPERTTDFRLSIVPGTRSLTIRIRTSDSRTKIIAADRAQLYEAATQTVFEQELLAPVGGFTSAPYHIGDYYFDGETEGVVVEVDPTGSAGKVIAMNDTAQPLAWGPDDTITSAGDEEDGIANMETIAAIDPAYAAYPAFKACAEWGEGWYLPAQKEMQRVRSVLDAVNLTLGWKGGSEISPEALYWSSTEADSYSDAMSFAADMSMPGMFGIVKTQPLNVRAFKQFGEVPEAKYRVGTLCEENGKRGIVFWVSKDGQYAKILSLAEQQGEWGPVGTTTGATDTHDGEKNLSTVRALDATLQTYSAFGSCAAQGQGWYLPSLNEMVSIAKMQSALNIELTKNGGTPLASVYYWSSTEEPTDGANSAQCVLAGSAATLVSSKNVSRNVRATAYVGTRPAPDKKYAIGDAYLIDDEVIGIVCAVTDDGLHGRIIAMKNAVEGTRINAMWDHRADKDNYVLLGASDQDDGRANMEAAKANDPLLTDLLAFQVCANLGDGWYLGAVNEVKALCENKSVLNAALRANSGSTLDDKEYWTSTEGSEDATVRAVSVNLKDGTTFDYRKYTYLLVRPMKAF